MSVQTQVAEALRVMINALNPLMPVTVGPLAEGEGLAMALTAGQAETVSLSLGGTAALEATLTCRSADQATALETLCQIHETLTRAEPPSGGESWQLLAVDTASAPAYVGREGPYWLYGSALRARYAMT
jgi:hypothetical protein